jgi:hypothetical protein
MREKIIDLRGGVRVDAEQDITQIRERVDVVQVARRDQRVEASEIVAARGVADEQKIFPPESNDPQRALRGIVV